MKLSEDFTKKLGFSEEGEEIRKLERSWSKLEDSVEFDEEEEAGEEEEFSFACVNAEGSPITAEEAFEDGQIRHVLPLFNCYLLFDQNDGVSETDDEEINRPRLRKVFVESHIPTKKVRPLFSFCGNLTLQFVSMIIVSFPDSYLSLVEMGLWDHMSEKKLSVSSLSRYSVFFKVFWIERAGCDDECVILVTATVV